MAVAGGGLVSGAPNESQKSRRSGSTFLAPPSPDPPPDLAPELPLSSMNLLRDSAAPLVPVWMVWVTVRAVWRAWVVRSASAICCGGEGGWVSGGGLDGWGL